MFKSECPTSPEEFKIKMELEEPPSSQSEPELENPENPPSCQPELEMVDSDELVQDLVDWLIGQCLTPIQVLPHVVLR